MKVPDVQGGRPHRRRSNRRRQPSYAIAIAIAIHLRPRRARGPHADPGDQPRTRGNRGLMKCSWTGIQAPSGTSPSSSEKVQPTAATAASARPLLDCRNRRWLSTLSIPTKSSSILRCCTREKIQKPFTASARLWDAPRITEKSDIVLVGCRYRRHGGTFPLDAWNHGRRSCPNFILAFDMKRQKAMSTHQESILIAR